MLPAPRPDDLFLALQAALAGRYSLERELGRGGMGIVYLARDVRLDRPVALKLLPPERAAIPQLRESFLREARMAARLAHPNIVPIHAVEEIGSFVFYAMRYVAGETLGERLRRVRRLAPHDASRLLRDTAYALAYAHAQGVIHRDIKPDNILLEDEGHRAVVTDFGIARLVDSPDATGGRVVGTPEYVAPEQAAGEAVDGRSDLYALGAMGFHCIAGRPPFEGSVPELLAQHLTRPAPGLLTVAPETPLALAETIDRALRKDPAERFESAEAMAEAMAPTSVATAELPVPVRVWVYRGRELKGMYVIWSCFFYGVGTMAYVANASNSSWSLASLIFIAICAKATVAPWIGHGLWRISQTRRALESGVSLDDLRAGLDVALDRHEEELRYEESRPIHWIPKLVRVSTYAAFAGALFSLFGGVFLSHGFYQSRSYFGLFGLFTMMTVGGAMFGLVFPGRRLRPVDPFARLRRWVWNGPLGRMMGRVASIGLSKSGERDWAASRATETALGSATGVLFDALPAGQRAALADLPVVVSRLEREAVVAREQLDRGAPGPWGERLERAVAAIETLRVGLLRMTAGHANATAITAELNAARELAERIDYLMAGEADVDALLADEVVGHHQSTQAPPMKRAASTSLG
ncbi:MAG: serine/threonine-protein kinase [Gemmatimonadota bacterium]